MSAQQEIKEGIRVAYARKWLNNTGQFTGEVPFMRGTVVKTEDVGPDVVCTVKWDGRDKPMRVLRSNLWPADKLHLEPN
jgi:hypothetical protein